MGRKPRLRPKRLAKKLRQVRLALGISQTDMLNRLGFDVHYSRISEYELGKNEPRGANLKALLELEKKLKK